MVVIASPRTAETDVWRTAGNPGKSGELGHQGGRAVEDDLLDVVVKVADGLLEFVVGAGSELDLDRGGEGRPAEDDEQAVEDRAEAFDHVFGLGSGRDELLGQALGDVPHRFDAEFGLGPEVVLEGAERDSGPFGREPGRGAGVSAFDQEFDRRVEHRGAGRGGAITLLAAGTRHRPREYTSQSTDL